MATTTPATRLTVLGAGTMGAGISALAIGHGVPVTLVDVSEEVLGRARTSIGHQLRLARLMDALPHGRGTAELRTSLTLDSAADSEVVIEAITEDPAVKAKVIAEVSALTRHGIPLVSNTSGIPIDELACSARRPGELVGTHFMNPPYLIGMAEVVRGPRTAPEVLAKVQALLSALGRRTVVVGDSPGFVTSRLLHPMINDAARIVGAGTATAEDVDTLMQGCLGHPTGPLRTADLIGLDNLADALTVLAERTGNPGYQPCETLLAHVRAGRLGRKSGQGFYDYGEAQP
ncbi:3-hydroxyacyl-CoA dehydrogenase family protein [Crossiella sp. NPDC003009]